MSLQKVLYGDLPQKTNKTKRPNASRIRVLLLIYNLNLNYFIVKNVQTKKNKSDSFDFVRFSIPC